MRYRLALVVALALAGCFPGPAVAPRAPESRAIYGQVRDAATGAVLAGAVVVVVSSAMPGEQVVVTDADGAYRFGGLVPGLYNVIVYYERHDISYQQARRDVAVSATAPSLVPLAIDLTSPAPQEIRVELHE